MAMPWWTKAGAAAFVAWSAWTWWHDRPVEPPAGVLAPDDPVQVELGEGDASPLPHGDWTLQPRAGFTIVARVLSRETYSFDGFASASRVDLALGWGPMSDSAVLAPLEIEQGARFYTLRWESEPPQEPAELLRHSSNVHTIATDDVIQRRLRYLRAGEVVRLEGRLVDGTRADGATFRTSLTREDTGAGACEVLLVERLDVLPQDG
jgi:hypothetical protein